MVHEWGLPGSEDDFLLENGSGEPGRALVLWKEANNLSV